MSGSNGLPWTAYNIVYVAKSGAQLENKQEMHLTTRGYTGNALDTYIHRPLKAEMLAKLKLFHVKISYSRVII